MNRASLRLEDAQIPGRGVFVEVSVLTPSGDGLTPHAYMPKALISFDSLVEAVKTQIAIDDAAEAPAPKRKTAVKS